MLRDQHENELPPDHAGSAQAGRATRSDGTPEGTGPAAGGMGPDADANWLTGALEALPRAITTLPRVEQRLVIGRYYEERPVEDLARELSLSPGRAASLLGDALGTLRRKIGY